MTAGAWRSRHAPAVDLRRRVRVQEPGRTVRRMSYSQPDPAEETTQSESPEQPDTDQGNLEEQGGEPAALEIDADDVPTKPAD